MTRRRLRPDEVELWRKVAQTTQKLHMRREEDDQPTLLPKPKPAKPPQHRIERFELGEAVSPRATTHDFAPNVRDHVASAPLAMDKKTFGKLKRGKVAPEGKLDLHGMTMEQAHPTLIRFILTAQAEGKRMVLVITGKGKPRDEDGPIPTRLGVLRHNVPFWLAQPPLAQAILQLSEAHIRHGGGGAYYVYLRRSR